MAKTFAQQGCPDHVARTLVEAGVTEGQLESLAAAGIDWQKVLQNLPQLITLILSMLGK